MTEPPGSPVLPRPPASARAPISALAFDRARGTSLVFGGSDGCNLADTWEYGPVEGNLLVGAGLGPTNPNRLVLLNESALPTPVDFFAYSAGAWGVNVTSAELDAQALPEIATAPGPGDIFGPHIRAFRSDGTVVAKINFFAYGTLKFGANVASGRVDVDAYDEILTGAGPGAVFGPHIRGWNYDGTSVTPINKINFFSYSTLKYGANVSSGDFSTPTSTESCRPVPAPASSSAASSAGGTTTASACRPWPRSTSRPPTPTAINVSSADVERDGYAEIAVTLGPAATNASRFLGFDFDGNRIAALPGYDGTPFTSMYGGRLGLGDMNRDGAADLLAAQGRDPSATSRLTTRRYDGSGLRVIHASFEAIPGTAYGANPARGTFGY